MNTEYGAYLSTNDPSIKTVDERFQRLRGPLWYGDLTGTNLVLGKKNQLGNLFSQGGFFSLVAIRFYEWELRWSMFDRTSYQVYSRTEPMAAWIKTCPPWFARTIYPRKHLWTLNVVTRASLFPKAFQQFLFLLQASALSWLQYGTMAVTFTKLPLVNNSPTCHKHRKLTRPLTSALPSERQSYLPHRGETHVLSKGHFSTVLRPSLWMPRPRWKGARRVRYWQKATQSFLYTALSQSARLGVHIISLSRKEHSSKLYPLNHRDPGQSGMITLGAVQRTQAINVRRGQSGRNCSDIPPAVISCRATTSLGWGRLSLSVRYPCSPRTRAGLQ